MNSPFGPWSTAMSSDTALELSAFWKRRMALLPLLTHSKPALSRREFLGLGAAGLAVAALPILRGKAKSTKLTDAKSWRDRVTLAGHLGWVEAMAFSPDGMTLAVGSLEASRDGKALEVPNGQVKLWDTATGQLKATFPEGPGVDFSPDGKLLATGDVDGTVRLRDSATGEVQKVFKGGHILNPIMFTPDGKTLITASAGWLDFNVRVWDVASGQGFVLDDAFFQVALSPDGKTLVTSDTELPRKFIRHTLSLWDMTILQKRIPASQPPTDDVHGDWPIAFSPNGKTLAIPQITDVDGTSGRVLFWHLVEGREMDRLPSSDVVISVAFSPDGTVLATGTGNGKAKLWDVATKTELATLEGHSSGVHCKFSPDGKTLATAGTMEGIVKLWKPTDE